MIRDEILSTLAYYNVLDMPLREHELFRYLIKKDDNIPTFSRMSECLGELMREGSVDSRDGYYFLFGREYLVPLRLRRKEYARRKWAKTYRFLRYLRAVPFVRLVFASGSLSMDNTDEQSDLDVIIVARHGRIWLTRLFVSGLLTLLRARRAHNEHMAPDKICPNHFITDNSLAIPFQNLYTAQLYANLVPMIVTDGKLLARFREQNSWVLCFLHRWEMDTTGIFSSGTSRILRLAGEAMLSGPLGDRFERRAGHYQRRRIESRAVSLRPGGHLTYTDDALAFHAESSEQDVLAKYEDSQSKFAGGLH